MASTDAKPVPTKGVAFRITLPIFDADGDLVSSAADLDSEVSLDGAAFADCANEATEIGSSGMYYLDLTADEMNADCVVGVVKTSTEGAKSTPFVLYPAEAADIPVNVTAVSGDATAADNLEAAADGTGYNLGGGDVVAASVTGAVGSVTGAVGSVTGNVGGSVASVTAGVTLANDAITASKFDESTAFPLAAADTGATAVARTGADSDTLETLSDEIATADAVADAIKAKTDNLPASPAAVGSAMTLASGAIVAATFGANALADASVADDMDTYQAKVWAYVDGSNVTDRYVAIWHKNGQPITSGITSPTLQIIKVADGADLVASTALTQIGSTGMYRHDETSNVMVAGAAYIAKAVATIGGASRTWYQPLGRDSTAA